MEKLILVSGATGNLGQRICRELIKNNTKVRALVRHESSLENVAALEKMGVDVVKVNMSS